VCDATVSWFRCWCLVAAIAALNQVVICRIRDTFLLHSLCLPRFVSCRCFPLWINQCQKQMHRNGWLCAHTVSVMVRNGLLLLYVQGSRHQFDACGENLIVATHFWNDCLVWWWVIARLNPPHNKSWCVKIYRGRPHLCGCVGAYVPEQCVPHCLCSVGECIVHLYSTNQMNFAWRMSQASDHLVSLLSFGCRLIGRIGFAIW